MPDNAIQISTALLLLIVITLPPGWLSLRLVRLSGNDPALRLPAAVIFGSLLLSVVWYLMAVINGGTISLAGKMLSWLLLTLTLAGLNFWWMERRQKRAAEKNMRHFWKGAALIVISLTAFAIPLIGLGYHDEPAGDGWIYRTSMHDWSKHIAVGTALATSPHLPPPNPFLGSDPAMRYHYFGYMLPAAVQNLMQDSLTIANVLIAQAALAAGALPFLIFGYARTIGLSASGALFSAFLATLVSGLDVVYMLIYYLENRRWYAHIDGWAEHAHRRINGIPDMFIWTPHHIIGLAGFLLALWLLPKLRADKWRIQLSAILLLALTLSALSGTSSLSWAALIGCLGVFCLLEGWRWLWKKEAAPFASILLAILISLTFSAPHLAHVFSSSRGDGPIVFQISPTRSGLLYGGIFSQFFGRSAMTYALDFPLQMIPEFGLVLFTGFAGGWLLRRRAWSLAHLRLWTIMLPIFFFLVLAAREGRPDTNNYAPRIAPMAMILLALLSGYWWENRRETRLWRWIPIRLAVFVMILAGLGTAFYEPFVTRFYPRFTSPQEAELYTWLNDHLGPDEVYQIGPQQFNHPQRTETPMFLVERRAGFADPWLAEAFTAELWRYEQALDFVERAYSAGSAERAVDYFRTLKITHVVTSDHIALNSMADERFGAYFQPRFENTIFTVYEIISGAAN